jgi:Xaa-Pro aminopeptidase
MDERPTGPILVRGAAPGGGVNPYFRYLTGLAEQGGALLLSASGVRIYTGRKYPGPDYVRGRMANQVLFLPAGDPLLAQWGEDSAATVGSVSPESLGVDAVLPSGDLNEVLAAALVEAEVFHYVRGCAPTLAGPADFDSAFVDRVRQGFFGLRIEDATPSVEEMRRLKDDDEVGKMRRAIEVTHEAIQKAWWLAAPGMMEYQVEAAITGHYRSKGGTHAFEPIVAAGPRACMLHYVENDREIEAGQLVLIDTGCSLDGYNADITRTFPVDGQFTPRQREVYEVVLAALEAVNAAAAPGTNLGDLHATAFEIVDAAGFGKYFVHGTSHYLGMETHDVGDRYRPLLPGAVITVEPGIYIQEEGLGVRIEDDLLITTEGCEVLSRDIPKTVEDMESILARKP